MRFCKTRSSVSSTCLLMSSLLVFACLAGCSATETEVEAAPEVGEAAVETLPYEGESLMVYSGAGLSKPMDEIAEVFKEETGCTIKYTYAGSAQNLSQVELTGQGDVYVPGAKYYSDSAVEKGLAEEGQDFAYHVPVIGVPVGNPAGITCLEDLGNDGIDVVFADPEAAAIGKAGKKMLENAGLWESVSANFVAQTPTVNELVVYMAMGQADATIIWEDNIAGVDDVEIVQIADELNDIKTIPVCVLTGTTNHDLAQAFADFVAGEEGKAIYAKHGFRPVE
ncbi:MAG: molybdate ABC transporter substrate-binding protein [Coriobacteriia bacterium]|nr:molybdate ABC transporter substrate-binding protein [Coriobacteriia bacterium]